MTVIQLRERAAAEAEAARDIKDKADAESRGMTTEEAKAFDSHLIEAERLEAEANRQEKLEKTEARLNAPQPAEITPEITTGARIEVKTPELFHHGKLQAFTGPKAKANAFLSGKWLLATIMNNAEAKQWCRDHGVRMAVMTEGINSAGGFLVPTEMEDAIIDLRETFGVARQYCRIHPMSSDATNVPRRAGGLTAYFVGEEEQITESEKSWSNVELVAKKLAALARMSTDLSEDSIINLADDLAREMAYAFAVKEDTCLFDGDGSKTYGGMTGLRTLMIDGDHAASYVEAAAAGDNWSEIDDSDLDTVEGALPEYADVGAAWFCSKKAKVSTFKRLIKAAGGATAEALAEGKFSSYSGYPIVTTPAMPSDDSSAALNGKIMIIFGNLRQSTTFASRRGITIQVSDQRYMEYDQIGLKATERFTIVNHDIGDGSTTGPVVGLLGNT
jgi:HK97 family phage major capsid protein